MWDSAKKGTRDWMVSLYLCEGDTEELRARHVGEVGVAALPGGEVGDGDGLQLRAEAGHVLLRHLQ
jgi:hypothetical protein